MRLEIGSSSILLLLFLSGLLEREDIVRIEVKEMKHECVERERDRGFGGIIMEGGLSQRHVAHGGVSWLCETARYSYVGGGGTCFNGGFRFVSNFYPLNLGPHRSKY